MRVLQIHNRYRQSGGENTVVAVEAELLRSAGHEVVQLLVDNPVRLSATVATLAVAPWNPAAARRARAVVDRVQPDVVHVHNTWFTLSPAVVDAVADVGPPVVMTVHNYRLLCANAQLYRNDHPCQDCIGSHPWHAVRHGCYRGSRAQSVPAAATIAWNARRRTWQASVARFVAPTRFVRDRLVAGGFPANRIEVRPHVVPDPGPRQRPAGCSRELLYVGRASPEKGLRTLVEAFAELDDVGLTLAVVGDVSPRGLSLRASSRVAFLGSVDRERLLERMRHARAVAVPSLVPEAFGLVAAEAMAAGAPAIASDVGGLREVVGDGGWLVPPGDVSAWRTRLHQISDDDASDAGVRARRRWERRFSPTAVRPRLEETYRQVIASHEPVRS